MNKLEEIYKELDAIDVGNIKRFYIYKLKSYDCQIWFKNKSVINKVVVGNMPEIPGGILMECCLKLNRNLEKNIFEYISKILSSRINNEK